ncbi:Protein PROTON GRADIENT REGULATION 3 [Cladobotryum mycophilum]|uniref:Protein PROTON GRADIENT REGULATION 3 n=1 Tax=Cladobotryum mycophilum TaxID=491253 RepID=A0ABR0S4S0_9HYPO
MPTALMFRTTSLRLNYCTRISPRLPFRPHHRPPWRLAARQYSSTLENITNDEAPTFKYDASTDSATSQVSLRLQDQELSAVHHLPNPTNEGNRFSNKAGQRERKTQLQEHEGRKSIGSNLNKYRSKSSQSSGHAQRRHIKKGSRSTSSRSTHTTPFVHRSATHITWNRVHETIKRTPHLPNRFSDNPNGDDTIPEPKLVVRRLRGMHLQWGYIRHQSHSFEVLASRRLFSSWKIKFQNVAAARDSSSYGWGDDGKWLFEYETIPEMRNAWEELDMESRREKWPSTMLSTLYSCPNKAQMVLEATLDPLPPGYAILDVLTFIARHLQLDTIKNFRERTLKAEETLDLLAKILEDMPPRHVPFGQRAFGIFARKLPSDQASDLYAILQRSKHTLHPNTQLQFASKLAGSMSHKETAFSILKGLAERGVDLNGPSPKSAITSLLHCKANYDGWSQETQTFSPRDALEFFMEKGFSPNHINATAFLDSLCQQSEVEEAIRLALLFTESGVNLDKRTWSTIFRGAKRSLKVENIVKSFDVAKAANAPYIDVLNNSLHSIYYFADMESRENALQSPWILPIFEPMLRLYAKKFDLEPLQRWLPDSLPLIITQPASYDGKFEGRTRYPWRFLDSIVPVIDNFFSMDSNGPRIRPSTTTVAIMLRAYIKTLRQPYDLMAFYTFFKTRLEENAGRGIFAAQLIKDQGTLIHDTIIMTMTERKGLSRPALQIFGDMLKDHMQRAGSEKSGVGSNKILAPSVAPIHPPPSLCTFSILVRGLMNRGDRILAEQVIQVMREQGIEPNLVTWNTLIKGYAVMQNIAKTVETLQDMEAAGFKPDLFTFKAFGKLRNQAKALEMMESIISTNREKMVGEELYDI